MDLHHNIREKFNNIDTVKSFEYNHSKIQQINGLINLQKDISKGDLNIQKQQKFAQRQKKNSKDQIYNFGSKSQKSETNSKEILQQSCQNSEVDSIKQQQSQKSIEQKIEGSNIQEIKESKQNSLIQKQKQNINLNLNEKSEYESQIIQPTVSSQNSSYYIQMYEENWRDQVSNQESNPYYNYNYNQNDKNRLFNQMNKNQDYYNQLQKRTLFNQVKGPEDDWSPTQSMIDEKAKVDFGLLVEGMGTVKQVFGEYNNKQQYQFELQGSENDEKAEYNDRISSSDWSDSSNQENSDSDEIDGEQINSSDLNTSDSIDTQINLKNNGNQTSERQQNRQITGKINLTDNSIGLDKIEEQRLHYICSKQGKYKGNQGQEKEFKYQFIEGNLNHRYKTLLNSKQKLYDIGIGKKYCTLLSGCAGTVIIKRQKKLYIASIGDTQAILFRNNWIFNQTKSNKNQQYIQLTQKHLPTEENEKLRIYHNQGEVKILKNDYIPKIFVRGRDYPGLHISRSIGDKIAHKIGVSGQPDIREYDINKQLDYFLIICTQSVCEFLDPQEIYHVLSTQTEDKVRDNTDMLQKRIKQAWSQNENYIEDYTFIVIYFQ
ncbi:Protein phosphatase 2C (PP2C)-like domain [Pseudocohnilembus persalinus]|uniref:Protein phosphatase 2C (PP2C)-like domain n=1 Tax=Pseudocohnilembus persalinus TaxID=266149 RepID=A0A0V0Q910_PSEPJ|nr:Protein phosphatase 2C (PP2C)-like domain [Pseudocohnilembus persalinus]|eukprot:KRW98657.1 Protein phosphatase 2C (PP2C)-like domain [Pseudocohnilembus persalinus]